MKRDDPPFGGPCVAKIGAPEQSPHTRPDLRGASSPPSPLPSAIPPAPKSLARPVARLVIILEPRGRGRYDAFFGDTRIASVSTHAISDAARALHKLGHLDGSVVVVRHNGAAHDAISGPLGYWRKVRAREDRGIPRHAGWEAYATRRERAQNARCTSGAGEIAPGSSAHPDPRPAQSRLSKRSRNKPDLAGAGNRRSKP
jgi:hypothetical protein